MENSGTIENMEEDNTDGLMEEDTKEIMKTI